MISVPTLSIKYMVDGNLIEETGKLVQSLIPQFRSLIQIRTESGEVVMIPYHEIVEIRSFDFDEGLMQDLENNFNAVAEEARRFEEQIANGTAIPQQPSEESPQYG